MSWSLLQGEVYRCIDHPWGLVLIPGKWTNVTWKGNHLKLNYILQPSIFRGHVTDLGKLYLDLFWWWFFWFVPWYHHFSPPFGRICFSLFPSIKQTNLWDVFPNWKKGWFPASHLSLPFQEVLCGQKSIRNLSFGSLPILMVFQTTPNKTTSYQKEGLLKRLLVTIPRDPGSPSENGNGT